MRSLATFLQLRDAVLVIERNGRAVLDGIAEVVDADVVTELLPGELLAHDQRVPVKPVKPMNDAFGSARRMFSARVSYWLRCASAVMTMTSERSDGTRVAVSPLSSWNLWMSVKT
jgi:hypothetical protein